MCASRCGGRWLAPANGEQTSGLVSRAKRRSTDYQLNLEPILQPTSKPSVFARLFQRLSDLIPHIDSVKVGDAFYAPPRVVGDMAVYCTVSAADDGHLTLEMSHDHLVDNDLQAAPWMAFDVDLENKTAELLALLDARSYIQSAEDGRVKHRRAQVNIFALNGLTVMLKIHSVFRAAPSPALLSA